MIVHAIPSQPDNAVLRTACGVKFGPGLGASAFLGQITCRNCLRQLQQRDGMRWHPGWHYSVTKKPGEAT